MIRVVVDDLAFLASDAIVRPTTARLESTTPAIRQLEVAGGPEFAKQLQVHRDLAVGAAVVTRAGGQLPAEFVVHAVIQSESEIVSREGVMVAWRSALQRAQEWEFVRITTPLIGTGAGNLSLEDAAQAMVDVLGTHLAVASFPQDVAVVVETAEERELFDAVLHRAGLRSA